MPLPRKIERTPEQTQRAEEWAIMRDSCRTQMETWQLGRKAHPTTATWIGVGMACSCNRVRVEVYNAYTIRETMKSRGMLFDMPGVWFREYPTVAEAVTAAESLAAELGIQLGDGEAV